MSAEGGSGPTRALVPCWSCLRISSGGLVGPVRIGAARRELCSVASRARLARLCGSTSVDPPPYDGLTHTPHALMKRDTPPRSAPQPRRRLWARIVGWLFLLAVLGGALGAIGLAGLFYYYGSDPKLPQVAQIHSYRPKTVTRIRDRKGRLIGEIAAERRTVVPFSRIPKALVQAVVAAEDGDFFKHRGLDYIGMLRAFFANLRAGHFVQGGSTITQQLIKTYFLSAERTIKRKMQEVILARQLESELSKNEIMLLYLNQIYYGHGRYGVEEASRYFFDKPVERLDLAECALLAGLPQSPARLSPIRHPQRAKRRQSYVLRRMVELGFLRESQGTALVARPIRIVKRRQPFFNAAPEFVDLVRAELIKRHGEEKLAHLGLDITTTVDAELQQAARFALQTGLRALDQRQGYRRRLARAKGRRQRAAWNKRIRRENRLLASIKKKKVADLAKLAGHNFLGWVRQIDDAKQELTLDLVWTKGVVALDDERYNPLGHLPSRRFSVGDVVRVRADLRDQALVFAFDPGPQAALIAMDPATGDVLAMVGGYDYTPGDFNRALRASRQPGSCFKPFVYGAALESGRFTAASMVIDAPKQMGKKEVRNFARSYRGSIRLRTALTHSVNTVAVRLFEQVGADAVVAFARKLGVQSDFPERGYTLALGNVGVRPVDMCRAYAALANGGRRVEPHFVLKYGREQVSRSRPEGALKPEVAYVLTSMMTSVVQEGTARRARRLGRPVAGKTGTTNQSKNAWFVGFTPQVAAAVWVGFDRESGLGNGETGGRAALPIWVDFMRRALSGRPKRPFPQPPGVVVERIDPKSGLLAAADAADAIEEVFVAGTEPKESAPAPGAVDPNTILMGPSTP